MSVQLGNPACWAAGFNYNACCSAAFGPEGNAECWDGHFTFRTCCFDAGDTDRSTCWEDARRFIDSSGDSVGAHPALAGIAGLETICCYPTATSQLCWGAGQPGGSPSLKDNETGEELPMTRRYVECCFPVLKRRLKEDKEPNWMKEQLDHDFAPWLATEASRPETLDEFEAKEEPSHGQPEFCRFRIRPNGIYHCDFGRYHFVNILFVVRDALHVLRTLVELPTMDFLIANEEYFGVQTAARPNSTLATVPILVQAQPEGERGILMPWWAFLQVGWTHLFRRRMEKAASSSPWHQRKAALFWRGSDTGCLLPESPCIPEKCQCSDWNSSTWTSFPRSRLVWLSAAKPELVDAKYSKAVVHADLKEDFKAQNLWVDNLLPPDEHIHHKYLMYIDGTSFSDRLFWLPYARSLIFRATSRLRVWSDGALEAGKHYLKTREDLADLPELIQWARENDDEAKRIALAGTERAEETMTLEVSLHYFFLLLRRLSRLRVSTPTTMDPSRGHGKAKKHEPSTKGPAIGGSPDCWTLGFTPEFCCDLDKFGPGGNQGCWYEDYTLETCCTGELGTFEFWQNRRQLG